MRFSLSFMVIPNTKLTMRAQQSSTRISLWPCTSLVRGVGRMSQPYSLSRHLQEVARPIRSGTASRWYYGTGMAGSIPRAAVQQTRENLKSFSKHSQPLRVCAPSLLLKEEIRLCMILIDREFRRFGVKPKARANPIASTRGAHNSTPLA